MDTRKLCSPPKTVNLSALSDYLFVVLKKEKRVNWERDPVRKDPAQFNIK